MSFRTTPRIFDGIDCREGLLHRLAGRRTGPDHQDDPVDQLGQHAGLRRGQQGGGVEYDIAVAVAAPELFDQGPHPLRTDQLDGIVPGGPAREDRELRDLGLQEQLRDFRSSRQVIGEPAPVVKPEPSAKSGIPKIGIHEQGVGLQVVGQDGREIGRNERLPLPLRGAGDHDRFRLVGQVQRQELRPQLPELLRHDGARLAVCDQFIDRIRGKRPLRAVSWIPAQRS